MPPPPRQSNKGWLGWAAGGAGLGICLCCCCICLVIAAPFVIFFWMASKTNEQWENEMRRSDLERARWDAENERIHDEWEAEHDEFFRKNRVAW